ncbi:hypothetical protein L7F22_019106 [Adiantum nelumboides]|nr:hypothetical protein [Adiantum nelumboides]
MFVTKTIVATTFALLGLTAQASPVQKRSTSGRATFYDVGMGNCGWSSSSNEYVVALNTAQYGSTSQVSGACGQTITINYNGKSAQAKIVDSCPTCPYGALDLSTGLFSYLTNGNMGLGEIQMNWSWGSGSSSNSNSNSNSNNNNNSNNSNNNNNNNSNNNNNNDSNSKTSSSSSTPTQTPTPSSTSSSTPSATSTASANAPSGDAQKTVTGVPEWWASIGNAGCDGTQVPSGADVAAIGPSANAESDDLSKMCGKWVEITNTANNKSTKAIVTSWLPGNDRNSIVLADAYKKVAAMNGDSPNPIDQVKWGFLN